MAASERLRAISAAREAVFHARGIFGWRDPDRATRTERGYLRDTSTCPPNIVGTISKATGVPSGPGHPLARALWLSDPSNAAWCPTPAEWEAEFTRWVRSPARNNPAAAKVATAGRRFAAG